MLEQVPLVAFQSHSRCSSRFLSSIMLFMAAGVAKELAAAKAMRKQERAASAKLFKGRLGPPPEPAAASSSNGQDLPAPGSSSSSAPASSAAGQSQRGTGIGGAGRDRAAGANGGIFGVVGAWLWFFFENFVLGVRRALGGAPSKSGISRT